MKQSKTLAEARKQIDAIDTQLLQLIRERMDIAGDVAAYKAAHALPVLDEQRERSVLADRTERASALGLPDGTKRVFETLMQMSRARQEEIIRNAGPVSAAFQGVRGANSHLALIRMLGDETESIACSTFADVFDAVSSGRVRYGVLPVENSCAGSVGQVLDLMGAHDVHIVRELSMPVDHMLAALPGTSIDQVRNVYSHEQALAQCATFLRDHQQMKARPFYNTAGAAQYVSESGDRTKAALCSEYAAELYGLEILYRSANASRDNTTRFILISAHPESSTDANKASLTFGLADKPGTLAQVLTFFARFGLNMARIESRPRHDRRFEYRFFVDFEGDDVLHRLEAAAKEDPAMFADKRLLGVYKSR